MTLLLESKLSQLKDMTFKTHFAPSILVSVTVQTKLQCLSSMYNSFHLQRATPFPSVDLITYILSAPVAKPTAVSSQTSTELKVAHVAINAATAVMPALTRFNVAHLSTSI